MHSIRHLAAASFIALLAPLSFAIAQDAPAAAGEKQAAEAAAKIDPAAKKIYDAGTDAIRKLKGISFTSTLKLEMKDPADEAMLPPGFGGKVRYSVRFAEGGKSGLGFDTIRADMLDGDNAGNYAVLAPEASISVNPKEKQYTEGGDMPFMIAGEAMQAFPSWFGEQRGVADGSMKPSEPRVLEIAGTASIEGVECDVIRAVRDLTIELGEGMPKQTIILNETIAFGRADGMLRQIRIDPDFGDEEMGPVPSPIYTIGDLKADPEFAAELFSTKAPEGFAKRELEMPGFPGGEPEMPQLAVKVGDAAPDFALKNAADEEVTMASLQGKVVLLDFWATWCGPCKAAMPTMQKLHDEYKDKGVVVLGVNMGERSPQAGKDYMASKKFTYAAVFAADALANTYGVTAIPTLVVIGKDGKIREIEVGLSDPTGDKLRKVIDEALAK
ncbi:MAG: hypothetical protein RLZZ238_2638 [Planctomycetota bacterium]